MRNLFINLKKKNTKISVILTIFSLFTLCNFIYEFNEKSVFKLNQNGEYNQNLVASTIYDLTGSPIFIDDMDSNYNWSKTAAENDWCTGSGTEIDPYIIQNVIIDGQNSTDNCLSIVSSQVFFTIRNCSFYGTSQSLYDHRQSNGIYLSGVVNGKIIDCQVDRCNVGMYLSYCTSISITSNEITNTHNLGVEIIHSNDNTIINNLILKGVDLELSDSNTFDTNNFRGITLDKSHSNIFYNNSVIDIHPSRPASMRLFDSNFNYFLKNQIEIVRDGQSGISLHGSDNNSFYLNNIDCFVEYSEIGGGSGFQIETSNNNDFTSNTIVVSTTGFQIVGSSYNMIYTNEINYYDNCFTESGTCISNTFEENECKKLEEELDFGPIIAIATLVVAIAIAIVTIIVYYYNRYKRW